MKHKTPRFPVSLILVICLVFGSAFPGARAESRTGWYENEWNFLEDSMDIHDGIPQDSSGVLGHIQRTGVLRVAVCPDSPPRAFLDPAKSGDEQFAGADLQLARLIAERMGVRLKITQLESQQILPSLSEDQCDLAISALSYTPGRALSYTLSKGYDFSGREEEIGLLIPEGSDISTLEDLANRIIITQRNSIAERTGIEKVRNYMEFRRAPYMQTVYETLQAGKADAAFVQIRTTMKWMENNPGHGLRLVEGLAFPLDEPYRGYRVAAKKGERELMAFVNGVIDEVTASGAYAAWLEEAGKRAEELGL